MSKSVRVSEGLYERVAAVARRERRPISSQLEVLLEEGLRSVTPEVVPYRPRSSFADVQYERFEEAP